MKTRLAMIAVLALGILMSATGVTLAIDGSSSSGSATDDGTYETTTFNDPSDPVDPGDPGDESSADSTRQAESDSGGSLPFTGFLAVPLLVGGVALLGGGIALRRRVDS